MTENPIETPSEGPAEPTDPGTAAEDTGEPDDVQEAQGDDVTEEPTTEEPPSANKEAAKYRTRLRATEKQLAATQERLAALQRREAERMAADRLATPGDLWLAGADLDGLLDENGDVDPAKVDATIAEVIKHRPHWALGRTRPSGLLSGASTPADPAPDPWAGAFAPRQR